jgi:hypothetical protein
MKIKKQSPKKVPSMIFSMCKNYFLFVSTRGKMIRCLFLIGILTILIQFSVYINIIQSEEKISQDDLAMIHTIPNKPNKGGNKRCGKKIQTPHYLEAKYIEEYTNKKEKDFKIKKYIKVFVNRDQKTFERRALYPSCEFYPEQDNSPIPVLFLIAGRSGSSNTWLTLSKLAGGKRSEAMETFGSGPEEVRMFFNSMKSEEEGSWWLNEHLCEVTKLRCKSAIAGIQWKPYVDSWTTPSAKGVLKQIARHNANDKSTKPKIRVLYVTRNPIDVLISREKHRNGFSNSHCPANDEICLNRHKAASKDLVLPTENLVQLLQESANQVDLVQTTLKDFGIDYYKTTYEKLYDSEDPEEWMKIFRYFGRGPMQGLTLDEIHEAFPMARTTSVSRETLLSNYGEVKEFLKDTKFEFVLN